MFTIDFDKVIKSDYPSCIKLLAMQSKMNGYTTPGQFFKELPDEDVKSLLEIAERSFETQGQDPRAGQILMLLTFLLQKAEGIEYPSEDYDVIAQLYSRTTIFITTESLKRKGLVEVNYYAFTYDLDSDEILAKSKS